MQEVQNIKKLLKPYMTSILYEGPPLQEVPEVAWVLLVQLKAGEKMNIFFLSDSKGIHADLTFQHDEDDTLETDFSSWLSRVLGGNYSFRKRGTTTTRIMEFAESQENTAPGWIGCNWLLKALDWDTLPHVTEAYATETGDIVLQWGASSLTVDVLHRLADWNGADGIMKKDLDLNEENTKKELRRLISGYVSRRPRREPLEDEDPPLIGYGDT